MKFKLNRNYVHVTKDGPSFRFEKDGEATYVPARYAAEIIGIGGIPSEEDAAEAAAAKSAADKEVAADVARVAKVKEVIKAMHARNQAGDFTAGGKPNPKKVAALVGGEVSQEEIDVAFAEAKAELQ